MSDKNECITGVNKIGTGNEKTGSEIAKTWLTGHESVTMIIEKRIAEEYGLTDPQYVILERKKEGILIRKLDI
jgi:hypothetical protein